MIKISHLTKIFKSKHKEKCIALNDVSVDLDEQGFVFIVGKSGSGKTTLLNMIAALDGYNSGEIIINGLSLNKLKHNQYDYYRNKNIGFVFQDYQLLDELTVFDNVKVALDFINDKDTSKVYKALESVGLKGFENRYPSQLSGGEKQRVAIARAMVKDPSIILADEPTGNLDSVTSKEILNILKEISKTKLVLIVSHNIFDAHQFASIILELSYGKLIGTYKRNDTYNSSIEVKDNILRLPLHKDLIEIEKDKVINDINNGINEVIQDDKDFIPCELISKDDENPINLDKKHINFKNAFKLGIAFIKKSLSTIGVFSLIIGALFGVIYSSEIIVKTDTLESLNQSKIAYDKKLITLADKEDTAAYRGKDISLNFIDDEDIKLIKDNGYQGKIYPTYNLFQSCFYDAVAHYTPRGVKVVDRDYFLNFTKNLDFQFENEVYKKEGVYLTDYIIDISNMHVPSEAFNYNEATKLTNRFHLTYLNGVINTHYKEKYPDIYETLKKYVINGKDIHVFDNIPDKRLNDFYYDLTFYDNSYSLEENFIDYILDDKDIDFLGYKLLNYKYNNKNYSPLYSTIAFENKGVNALGVYTYEALTGTRPSIKEKDLYKLDKPITIKIDLYKSRLNEAKQKSLTFTFDYLFNDDWYGYSSVMLDKKDKDLCHEFLVKRDVTLENNEDLQTIFKKDLCKNLTINDFTYQTTIVHDRLSSIFNKIFNAVIILLFMASFVALIFYAIYIVRKNIRNIGVLKSLGGRSKDILISLSLNIVITCLISSILSIGFSYLFLFIIEKILLSSYSSASLETLNTYSFKYLLNNPILIGLNVMVIIALLVLSGLIIFIRLNKFKPTELIKGAK